ncbi:MAG: DNA recombination protein RmuC [Alteromonadaceae bacterium]|jgi:DNA recombination protein RmuC
MVVVMPILENLSLTPVDLTFFTLLSFIIVVIILLWLQVRQLVKSKNDQSEISLKTLERVTLSNEMFERYQQQLSLNNQHFANQQAELKMHFEQQISDLKMKLLRQNSEQNEKQNFTLNESHQQLIKKLNEHQLYFNENQSKAVDQLIEHLNKAALNNRDELAKTMLQSSDQMAKRIDELTQSTDNRLKDISGQVEKRLADGFEKTTKTFNDILQRLALIDDAQKKITELSTNVVSLQEVLADKRSRGAFGEVQLTALIRNVMPEQHFSLQHTLSNGKIADCILFLPQPTGNVVIDSKFPLESYKKMADNQLGEFDRKAAERQFKLDIKKHINDISDKYLIDKETADGAIMFIPAEAIFAEIHAHQSDLVDYANKKRVWMASPTTLMAILTTSRSVLKDEETRKQIHVIQEHLSQLAGDFNRFRGRFNNLAKHIDQAANDVKQIHTSADKISSRFEKIEQVELKPDQASSIELAE